MKTYIITLSYGYAARLYFVSVHSGWEQKVLLSCHSGRGGWSCGGDRLCAPCRQADGAQPSFLPLKREDFYSVFCSVASSLQIKLSGGTPPAYPVDPLTGYRTRSKNSLKVRLVERVC